MIHKVRVPALDVELETSAIFVGFVIVDLTAAGLDDLLADVQAQADALRVQLLRRVKLAEQSE